MNDPQNQDNKNQFFIKKVTFVQKAQLKIIIFQNNKHLYLIHPLSDVFKGTTVIRALLTLHGGSLENTLTVPL